MISFANSRPFDRIEAFQTKLFVPKQIKTIYLQSEKKDVHLLSSLFGSQSNVWLCMVFAHKYSLWQTFYKQSKYKANINALLHRRGKGEGQGKWNQEILYNVRTFVYNHEIAKFYKLNLRKSTIWTNTSIHQQT